MNEKLEAIADQAANTLRKLLAEASDTILTAWDSVVGEAQAQDTDPKLKLSYGITLDLGGNSAVYELSFGVRYKLSAAAEIPDPEQLKLPGVDGIDTVTISTQVGKPVTLSQDQLSTAASRLVRAAVANGRKA